MLELLTIEETASRLKFSKKTIYKMIRLGEIKAVVVELGRRKVYRVSLQELQRWIDSKIRLTYPNTEFVKLEKWL